MVQIVYNERNDVILVNVKQLNNCLLRHSAKVKTVWLTITISQLSIFRVENVSDICFGFSGCTLFKNFRGF